VVVGRDRRLRHALGSVARLSTATLARIVVISIVAQIPACSFSYCSRTASA
jgi:hypothetical protein